MRHPGLARSLHWLAFCFVFTSAALAAQAPAKDAPTPAPDTIIFTNGDQLTGTLERSVGSSVIFKSDMAGEITVSLDKVKELRSTGSFAVLCFVVTPPRANVSLGSLFFLGG